MAGDNGYPSEKHMLRPEQARGRMRFEKREDVYVLNGGIEKRMSTLAQQYRAISLVGSLLEAGKLDPARPIAIVGAGIAGITAAAVAASRGCKSIHVFEKRDRVTATFERSGRLIDPRLYEWPLIDWKIDNARLPLLNWTAAPGHAITETLREQWDGWMRVFGPGAAGSPIHLHEKQEISPEEVLADGKGRLRDCHVRIVAVGFGCPRTCKLLQDDEAWVHDYWESPPSPARESETIGVVGAQDGGLTEAIEHALWYGPRQVQQVDLRRLLVAFEEECGTRLHDIVESLREEDGRALDVPEPDRSEHLRRFQALREIGGDQLVRALGRVGFHVRTGSPVRVFIRTDSELELPVVRPQAFLVNRWLAAHLEHLGAIELVAIPRDALGEIRKAGEVYRVPTQHYDLTRAGSSSWLEVTRLLVRVGQAEAPGWEGFLARFYAGARALGERDTSWRKYIFYQIARRPPDPAPERKRCFYSDLYDSTTQRSLYDVLKAEGASGSFSCESASSESMLSQLVELYAQRFRRDLQERDFVLLSDNQVLDGMFFLEWLPTLNRTEVAELASKVRIGMRKSDPGAVYDDFVRDSSSIAREFEFSALPDEESRGVVTRTLLDAKKQGTRLEGIDDVESLLAGAVLEQWRALRRKQARLTEWLRGDGKELVRETAFSRSPLDQRAALEDPGQFAVDYPELNELQSQVFQPSADSRIVTRSTVYHYCNQFAWSGGHPDPLRDWYDRAYSRGIAFQQSYLRGIDELCLSSGEAALIVVFESVRLVGRPRYTARDGRPTECWDLATNGLVEVPGRPEDEDLLGGRVLKLLREAAPQRIRLRTEEASQVGPRVPAVVDFVRRSETKQTLSIVEYYGDLPERSATPAADGGGGADERYPPDLPRPAETARGACAGERDRPTSERSPCRPAGAGAVSTAAGAAVAGSNRVTGAGADAVPNTIANPGACAGPLAG